MGEKARVGVSSCLLGEKVRYDGGDKLFPWLKQVLSLEAELISFCPEMIMGLGVPRETIGLYESSGSISLRRNKDRHDLSQQALKSWERLSEELKCLDAFILKSKSPSCGLESTKLYDLDSKELVRGGENGFFVHFLKTEFPELYLIDELSLHSESGQADFLEYLIQTK